jgi:methyl-accepting chemotaxis protein
MFDFIKRKLSLKVSLVLTLITIPPMVLAAFLLTEQEAAQDEQLTINRGKVAAMSGAKMYGTVLEAGIDSGVITVADLMEPTYEVIKGYDFGENPRFHTKYDFYTDRTVMGFEDALLESSSDFIYAFGMDMNGYLPTHNSKFNQPLTNDKNKDLAGNRNKRKFTNLIGTANNLDPVLVQAHKRDTGELSWDIQSPIFVKGRHYGVFRVGVSRDSIAIHHKSLLIRLSIMFGFLMIVTVGFIFWMLRRSMRPLEHLAQTANAISTGEGLDQQIKLASNDEIGQMAKSLNRLRSSLQAAMARLGE